jgi:quinolinate synthase
MRAGAGAGAAWPRLHRSVAQQLLSASLRSPPGASAARAFSAAAPAAVGTSAAFPSLLISAKDIVPQGSFAESQAAYMTPDCKTVQELSQLCKAANLGVVSHYYMDAELQGTLDSLDWPHVIVADSLKMGDAAVGMARAGVTSIACLGVDFMAESVRANLDATGFSHVPVYRLSEKEIGCSLASSAERAEYRAWLSQAARVPNSLHVVYINTSLYSKAMAHSMVPTITCTSSNVLQTVLQAFAQVPGLTLWYGPDTYMGENLETMLKSMCESMSDEEIRAVHPSHTTGTLKEILGSGRFRYFKQGNCVVHHMFGDDVVARVRRDYGDAFHTAHLEVPGEMFALAMEASRDGRGVVGSTSNILNFIAEKAEVAVGRIQVVLGTESGMITSIVRAVQQRLRSRGGTGSAQVEIVFPVASEAMTVTGEGEGALATVPGVQGGEGCSTAGGCATCPFMKMNDLDGLEDLARSIASGGSASGSLKSFLPKKRAFLVDGVDKLQLGAQPILHMRKFMADKALGDDLVQDVKQRNRGKNFG